MIICFDIRKIYVLVIIQMFNKISKKSITLWRIRYTLCASAVAFLVGALYVFIPMFSIILAVISILIYIFLMFFYVGPAYRNTKYRIRKLNLDVVKGVFFRFNISMPIKKIKYIELTQTPAQRALRIASLKFRAAGSKMILAQIDLKTAEKIKNNINRSIDDEI